MKDSYLVKKLYIAIPSQLNEDGISMIQNPTNITVLYKDEENRLIDIFTKEEIITFDKKDPNKDLNKKYIKVFNKDIMGLRNYLYSINTDYIVDIPTLFKYLLDTNEEYTQKEILILYKFLVKEVLTFEYKKTKKIVKSKTKKTRINE